MKSKLRGIGLVLVGAMLSQLAGSVAFAEGPAIGGYVDTQYIYNWNKPYDHVNAFRSYDALDNNFTNTAHLALTGKLNDETNYVVEVDGGSDADTTTLQTSQSQSTVFLQEAYLNWVGSWKLGLKAGKFVTYEGIEVVESVANPTISRGFLFNLAEPISHVGAVATFVAGKFDFAAGLVNGWDQQDDLNKGKTFVGKVGMNWGDPLVLTVSGLYGPEKGAVPSSGVSNPSLEGDQRTSIDVTGMTKIIPKLDLAFQWNWGYEDHPAGIAAGKTNDSWSGFGIQPVFHATDKLFVGGRYEYFDNGNGSRVGGIDDFHAYNITVTPGYKINDNVVFRLEYRYDKVGTSKLYGDGKIFAGESVSSAKKDSQSTTSAQIAVTF